jgi:hypothetical protein
MSMSRSRRSVRTRTNCSDSAAAAFWRRSPWRRSAWRRSDWRRSASASASAVVGAAAAGVTAARARRGDRRRRRGGGRRGGRGGRGRRPVVGDDRVDERLVPVGARERAARAVGAERRLDGAEERLEHVGRAEREVGAALRVGQRPLAHLGEQRLGLVGEGAHAVEAEEGARPLDRVEGAEDGVDRLDVVGRALELEQGRLAADQALAALDEEVAEQLEVEVGREPVVGVGGGRGGGGRRGGRGRAGRGPGRRGVHGLLDQRAHVGVRGGRVGRGALGERLERLDRPRHERLDGDADLVAEGQIGELLACARQVVAVVGLELQEQRGDIVEREVARVHAHGAGGGEGGRRRARAPVSGRPRRRTPWCCGSAAPGRTPRVRW